MKKWDFFTTTEIKPKGWIKKQLEVQANGLCGNLDKVWPDVRESGWIGGSADAWERVPCWLDGFIPLAYLLENEDMIARAKKYMDYIIAHQRSDGWICPCEEERIEKYDTWPVQLFSKVLVVYYECSKDERIPEVLYKMLRNYYDLLNSGKIKLFNWGEYRWFETFIALNFLYDIYHEDWIVSLGHLLKEKGIDFNNNVPLWKRPLAKIVMPTHIVGLTLMLKHEAVSHALLNEPYTDRAEYYHKILTNYNGTVVGSYTGDEHLSGLSPIQGTELCAIVEQMYSFEQLFAFTGEKKWLERLEVLAFNALPATISDDMWTHQYDQQSNQINCIRFCRKPVFGTNNNEAHLFGLEPHYGCCTANHSHGWPKFTLSAFMRKGDTVMNTIPIPTALNTQDFTVLLETEYPFENRLVYTVDAKKDFTFKIRIPSFAKEVTVDGETANVKDELTFQIASGEKRKIFVEFRTEIELLDRPYNLKTVKSGSLLFSLPIAYDKVMYEYEANGVERKFPYCDYEYVGKSDWNYGYSDVVFEFVKKEISDIPFSSEKPPVTVKAKMKKIHWGFEPGYDTVCAKVPQSTDPIGEEEIKELYPYGCAKLRMTELPMV